VEPAPHDARPTCAIATLGCKVNQYESQAIRELMAAAGYRMVPVGQRADVTIVNTCAVTQVAARKSRQRLYEAMRANPSGRLVATGCLVESDEAHVLASRALLVPRRFAVRLPEILRTGRIPDAPASIFDLRISTFAGHARAFLKIQDGCDSCCAYCIVPRLRGPVVSRPLPDILAEACRLTARGYRELVLTGIHLGAYGRDAPGGPVLEDVVEALLGVTGIERLRLSSIEPNEVSERLLALMGGSGRLCPHLHLPLQSGDDDVLRVMNRRYTATQYLAMVARIKEAVPLVSLTTDILVGFPGESEAAFQRTLAVCRTVGFSRMHVFPFSPRPGTVAANLPGRVPPPVIRRRLHEAEATARGLALTYKRQFVGSVVEPLVENCARGGSEGELSGYTERYLRVVFTGERGLMGRVVRVRATHADYDALRGTLLTS